MQKEFNIEELLSNLGYKGNIIIESAYLSPIDFEKVINAMFGSNKHEYFTNQTIAFYYGFKIYADDIVQSGTFFICEPGLFDIYKKLKTHQWVDKNYTDVQLQNIAAGLWEAEKTDQETPRITMTFTKGETFPTGAKFTPEDIKFFKDGGHKSRF